MRKLGLLFMSIVLIVTLSACGSNSSSSSSSSSKEVVFWNPFTGPDGENMKRMVDE
ncbi:hypothetical protein [Lederbergia galactosidilytica]|uniref:hypothetical protein n=1 Tax=Lederbergia galactosidilytica TaxID=217031 RepID=UPI000AAFD2E4|nr:hypothetical protein [Lederbergia galactosidilytica]